MIVDTSAIVAILAGEPDAERLIEALSTATQCRISAATFVELSMVLEGQFGPEVAYQAEALFREIGMSIEPFTAEQAYAARQAFRDFGKGRHPAGLNLGDCFSYALAKLAGEPLLFKGSDFSRTDIVAAL